MILRKPDNKARLSILPSECKVCAKPFWKLNSLQIVCGVPCAIKLPVIARNTIKAQAKAERVKTTARKEALKTRADWVKDAQREFNAYIRLRDASLACISCGRFHQGQWHAGHYLSTGARPELRFDEDNVQKQCAPCNNHLHGNLVLYRLALIERIGLKRVERLEGPHAPLHLDAAGLKELVAQYRAKARAIGVK